MSRPACCARVLAGVCIVASAWVLCLLWSGGFDTAVGGVRLSSHSPRPALIVAVLAGLSAWAASIRAERVSGQPAGRRRHGGILFVVMLSVMVIGLNALTLLQPAPPADEHNCLFDNPLGHGFRHLLNCDSPEFLALAQDPAVVLSNGVRQSRPLSFGVPWLVARPMTVLPGVHTAWPYRPYAAEFAAYVVINVAVLVGALVLVTALLESATGVRGGPELMLALVVLGVNTLTKLFLWTPHVQIYNVFVSCLSLYLCYRLVLRGRALTAGEATLAGVALGAGVLAYGSFLLPLACIGAIQVLVYRRAGPSLLMVLVAAVPYVAWIAIVRGLTGSFYNHEIAEYRQFVWMIDCARLGVGDCLPIIGGHMRTFVRTAGQVLAAPILVIAGLRLARRMLAAPHHLPRDSARALRLALAVNLAITTMFLAAMGFYVPRLMWLLMPPVIVIAVVELQALRLSRPQGGGWSFEAGALALSVVYLAVLVSTRGPYT